MKVFLSITLTIFAAVALGAQTKSVSASEYRGKFQYAVRFTNMAFPFVYTVVTETYEDGKLVSTETEASSEAQILW
jgi:hypothetical protein